MFKFQVLLTLKLYTKYEFIDKIINNIQLAPLVCILGAMKMKICNSNGWIFKTLILQKVKDWYNMVNSTNNL